MVNVNRECSFPPCVRFVGYFSDSLNVSQLIAPALVHDTLTISPDSSKPGYFPRFTATSAKDRVRIHFPWKNRKLHARRIPENLVYPSVSHESILPHPRFIMQSAGLYLRASRARWRRRSSFYNNRSERSPAGTLNEFQRKILKSGA